MQLAARVNRISISPTAAVLAAAEKLRAQGVDLADFGPGEPDFPTPEHIQNAAIRALKEGRTKYTPTGGIRPLREAICNWHAKQFGSSYTVPECIVSVGGKHVLFNACCCLLEKGDEVLIPAPYWVTYPDIVLFTGATPVPVMTDASDGFRLRAEEVARAITPKTRMLIVNSPNNPSGAVVPREEFEKIYEICRAKNIWLVTDECYSHFVYGNEKPYSLASVPDSKPNIIVVGSLSKTFAMTGWRIGYALAPDALVSAMIKLQSQSTSNPTSIAQYAALEALTGPMDTVAEMLAEYARRRDRIVSGLRAIPGVTCVEPGGAFYAFPNVSAHLGNGVADTTELAKLLLEKQHLVVVPGDAFGTPGYLRLSYATSIERIEEGLRRLEQFFSLAEAAR
ncbi:MAG TPA: pyridoxal phosphate-dependent aminotransferase [Candidatus Dormibacteraeota bacterium]|nr:pyridoxal phosphate-dependent aminotransferase [Candidatus Dormibacteraeota bacterium]